MKIRSLYRCGVLAGAIALGACDLTVQNPNNPETERVLATPRDVETLLYAQYNRWHTAMYGSLSNVWGMANVLSFENFSGLANNGMGQVISIPRPSLNNSIGNGFADEHRRVYYLGNEVVRTASDILNRLDAPGFTLGSTAQDQKARAFAQFIRGLGLGYVALTYDSSAVISPGMSTEDPGELLGYVEVMDSALSALQQAIDQSAIPGTGANGFPITASNVSAFSPGGLTQAQFVQLVRSYKARFRANVARTLADRVAVDWAAVIADAQNGITSDHLNLTNSTSGPFNSWVNQWMGSVGGTGQWHQMAPFVIGMADVSGSYAAWNAMPLDTRVGAGGGPFGMVTPDLRFPQGADRDAQRADAQVPCAPPNPTTFGCTGANAPTGLRYFQNRTTTDQLAGASWGWSQYDNIRFHDWSQTKGRNGFFPFFTKAELDLLQAEGLIRTSQYAAAAALIDITRVGRGGLPGVAGIADLTTLVPGGAACVPKVPPALTCGNLYEAMKYEKRIETHFTHFMAWFMDHRGWNDLPEGTGTNWAVPFEDLQARGRTVDQIYSTGGLGSGNSATAGPSTYGW